MQIKNSVVWITGASSGIGKALAKTIIEQGGKVILSARNIEKLTELKKYLKNKEKIFILPLDMENDFEFPSVVEKALKQWGTIDILINNAGVSQRSLVSQTEGKVVKKIIATNYTGPCILTSLVIPHMQKQQRGHCLFVSSVAGKFATPFRSTYAASKMALQGLSDSLRAEVYKDNIYVSLIVPGFVKTNISLNALEGKGKKHNQMDPNQNRGISPDKAAQKIVSGILRNKREIYCGLVAKTVFALFLSRYFPSLLAKVMRKANVT